MNPKYATLLNKLNEQLNFIDLEIYDQIKKCEHAITIIRKSINELKKTVTKSNFKTQSEEIQFFKEIKPQFTSKLFKISTYNLKQIIKQSPNFMKTSVKSAFVQHVGDKSILLHKLDGRGMIPIKTRAGNNCSENNFTISYLSSNIIFVLNSL